MQKICVSIVASYFFLTIFVQTCHPPPTTTTTTPAPVDFFRIPYIDVRKLGHHNILIENPLVLGGFDKLNNFTQGLNNKSHVIFEALKTLGGSYATNFAKQFDDIVSIISSANATSLHSLKTTIDLLRNPLKNLNATLTAADSLELPIGIIPFMKQIRGTLTALINALNLATKALNALGFFGLSKK